MNSLLIANRGEIARRIIRTARKLGIKTMAVYSDADRESLHVKEADEAVYIGESHTAKSYLNIERIVEAAKEKGADAIHPGYGFLAENPSFARAVLQEGLIFVGPSPEAMEKMGDKDQARKLALEVGVPISPGTGVIESIEEAKKKAQEIGYPVLLKAVAGGGGIGMERVDKEKKLEKALEKVRNRAQSAFGDDRVYMEKYLSSPHHIEIQVFGDRSGNVLTFFERECSVQRRHQKVIEESPSPFATESLRKNLREAARKLALALGYYNAGTIEFVVDQERNFYFLEVNTRLQVEHPITEAITGEDLVAWQLRIAQGESLPKREKEIEHKGHALEARIYAEDPVTFFPSPGKIEAYHEPQGEGIRVDSGYQAGDQITPFYDPLIAKLIVYGQTRREAIERMLRALNQFEIQGIKTNIPFLKEAFGSELFQKGSYDTHFIQTLRGG